MLLKESTHTNHHSCNQYNVHALCEDCVNKKLLSNAIRDSSVIIPNPSLH